MCITYPKINIYTFYKHLISINELNYFSNVSMQMNTYFKLHKIVENTIFLYLILP